MTKLEALEALLEKVRAGAFTPVPGAAVMPAYKAFSELADVALPQDVNALNVLSYDAYNGSLDAALRLHQTVLPGWFWYRQGMVMYVTEDHTGWGSKPHFQWRDDTNPARAWLCAILQALIAQERGG